MTRISFLFTFLGSVRNHLANYISKIYMMSSLFSSMLEDQGMKIERGSRFTTIIYSREKFLKIISQFLVQLQSCLKVTRKSCSTRYEYRDQESIRNSSFASWDWRDGMYVLIYLLYLASDVMQYGATSHAAIDRTKRIGT